MKLRIKGNTLRFRLTQSEVKAIENGEVISEKTFFGPKKFFEFTLGTKLFMQQIETDFTDGKIETWIPSNIALNWAKSDSVGIEHSQENAQEEKLYILIEKDFKCLTERSNEDESDNYPHPKEKDISC